MGLPRFLAELKRRKVYRVALVYAAVGWAILEASGMVLPRLALPDWTVNLVLAVVLLGFPLALVFAWIFDISPEGIVRTEPLSPADHPNPEQYRAIAVLPFADMSENKDQSWFAEGIAEELLIALSQVKPLAVVARTSSFAFKGTGKTIAEIAEILGVQAVLEGSVRRSEDRVRVTAELVDAHSGFRIWSGSYERQITDIFQMQDELAKSVVEALRIELHVQPSERLVAEQTRVPEAYNWFMRGRTLFEWANPQGTQRSISYFEKAVEADPGYAMAWGYLSFARDTMMMFCPFKEAGPPTIAALEHALAVDPEQSEALAIKAVITQLVDHDWETAGRLYQRAIASSQSGIAVSRFALFYLQFIDQQREAIELYAKYTKLDPLHPGNKANLAGMFYWAGDEDAAIRKAREALQLDPGHVLAIQFLIAAYTDKNDTVALDSLLVRLPPAIQELAEIKALVARNYAVRGNAAEARKIYNDLVASFDSLTTNAMFDTALLAISLDEIDESIEFMERLEKTGSWMLFWNKLLPMGNNAILENPRYQALLKRIGLDDESVAALNKRMSFK